MTKKSMPTDVGTDEEYPNSRELRVIELGQAWAGNPVYKNELRRFAEWRAPIHSDEWDQFLSEGADQAYSAPTQVVDVMMPDIFSRELARECWEEWLSLEPDEEIDLDEVRLFLESAFQIWEKEDMDSW